MPLGMLGKYERIDVLGHGATGIVYLAKDTLLDRLVALKEVPAQGDERDRYLREARTLDRLRHPNIVSVSGVSEIAGKLVIDMEYVRGRNLQDILRTKPRLDIPDALSIVAQICDGLAYAHGQHIVHRDIKPANIIVSEDGVVKLVDFGLAEMLGTHSFAPGAGTYAYMAPEDFREEELSDRQADIWAVGVMLYEMLAGRRPFQVAKAKDPFAWRRAIEEDPIAPLCELRPDAPDGLQGVLDSALARDKRERYAEASDMALDVRRLDVAVDPLSLRHLAAVHTQMDVDPEARTIAAFRAPSEAETIAVPIGAEIHGIPGLTHIDGFLAAAPDHWEAARDALIDGSLTQWLRGIREDPLADVAVTIAAATGTDDDARLRDFLYRSGMNTTGEARSAYAAGIQLDQHGRYTEASDLLRRAVRLDPTVSAYHLQLGRALRMSGDSVASALALETGLSHHPRDRALAREQAEAASNGVSLSPGSLDFGALRQGKPKAARVVLRNAGTDVLEGHVASMPGWVRVEPVRFSTRQRQPLTITADASAVWDTAAEYQDKVVLETSVGRQEIEIRMRVLPALLRLGQVFWWYVPALACALLPGAIGILRSLMHPSSIGMLWEPAALDSGLLCGSLFVLSVGAQTVWSLRAAPILLLLMSLLGGMGMLAGVGDPHAPVAMATLWQTGPPIFVMLILQAVTTLRDPQRWGRWQVWSVILIATGLLAAQTVRHVQ